MTITYTDNFSFPQMDDGGKNWGAVINGILEDVDALIAGCIRPLASATVNLQNGDGKSDVYTVPTGKKAIVTKVIILGPTASLAGGNDFDIGDGASADTWKQTIDLSTLTASTDCIVIQAPTTKFTIFDAADVFGIKPATGATADADATMVVFGYEYDA